MDGVSEATGRPLTRGTDIRRCNCSSRNSHPERCHWIWSAIAISCGPGAGLGHSQMLPPGKLVHRSRVGRKPILRHIDWLSEAGASMSVSGVKMRKSHGEHFSTAVLQKDGTTRSQRRSRTTRIQSRCSRCTTILFASIRHYGQRRQ
jgi:hypothetical protein